MKDTNLVKYINLIGRILRVLNIYHVPHDMPYAVVFDHIPMCPYLEKGGLLVIVFMDVERITFIGYICARYGNLGCGVRNTLVVS